jgi:hypothetical protein
MTHFLYHYLYVDLYLPVWPNIAASVIIGLWVVARVKVHLKRHHESIKGLIALHSSFIGRQLEEVHAHVSNLHPTVPDHSDSISGSTPLFAQQEAERAGDHIG